MKDEFMEIVVYILAVIGLACVVKYLMDQEGCPVCGWHKTEEEGKTKMEEGQSTGSRYGSNPVKY